MPACPILPGTVFNRLTVKCVAPPHFDGGARARLRPCSLCVCECGTELIVPNDTLKSGNTKSCGCLKTAEQIPIGTVFSRLIVMGPGPRKPKNRDGSGYTAATWTCACQCGEKVNVTASDLRHGRTVSCGCWSHRKNGESNCPEHKSWAAMIDRCYNPKRRDFPGWGGRGIAVCQRWKDSYFAFLADMGRRPTIKHSLDRFPDVNGNYEPGNVRWATAREQANNRRSNRLLEFRGEVKTLAEWAYALGFKHGVLHSRLLLGWTVAEALTVPSDNTHTGTRKWGRSR